MVAPISVSTTEKSVPAAASHARLETFKDAAATRKPAVLVPLPPSRAKLPATASARPRVDPALAPTAVVRTLPRNLAAAVHEHLAFTSLGTKESHASICFRFSLLSSHILHLDAFTHDPERF